MPAGDRERRAPRRVDGTPGRARHLGDDDPAVFHGHQVGERATDFDAYTHEQTPITRAVCYWSSYTYTSRTEVRIMKKLTITVDNDVYRGLKKKVGPRRISRFLNDLARPHVVDDGLLAAYRDMAADRTREFEAEEWVEGLIEDAAPQPE